MFLPCLCTLYYTTWPGRLCSYDGVIMLCVCLFTGTFQPHSLNIDLSHVLSCEEFCLLFNTQCLAPPTITPPAGTTLEVGFLQTTYTVMEGEDAVITFGLLTDLTLLTADDFAVIDIEVVADTATCESTCTYDICAQSRSGNLPFHTHTHTPTHTHTHTHPHTHSLCGLRQLGFG